MAFTRSTPRTPFSIYNEVDLCTLMLREEITDPFLHEPFPHPFPLEEADHVSFMYILWHGSF